MEIETSITTSHLALTAGVLLVAYTIFSLFIQPMFSEHAKYLQSQSWVGLKKQSFAKAKAGMDALKNTRQMVEEGYQKYSLKDKPFVLPQFSASPLLMISAKHLNELLSISDDKVDAYTPNAETVAQKWTTGKDVQHGAHIDVVRRQLTRRLPLLTTDVYEELRLAMKDVWNASEGEWTSVNAYPTCMRIVSRAANRVFAGKELCRNPTFIDHSREYSVAVFKCGAYMRMWPKWTHPFIAPYYTKDVKYHLAQCKKVALPIMRKRLADIQNPPPGFKAPVDALQWMLEDLVELAKNDPSELDEDKMTRRLLVLNMVAIHTTSMVTTNTILDLYSSPHKDEFVEGLREEVERVMKESGGEFTKNAINSMFRIDSTIRETMRYTTLGDVALRREVIAPEGIDLSNGVHIPKGTRVATANTAIHQDPAFYGETAAEWDGFRFSRPREAYLAQVDQAGGDPDHLKNVLQQKNQGLIATGEDFLSFGHGRHACPGRFFASQEMKLMIAHIVMNYDIKINGGRPPNNLMNGSSTPPANAEIQVRLRKGNTVPEKKTL